MKKILIKEIIERGLFSIASSFDKNKWILLKNGDRAPVFLSASKFGSFPELMRKVNKLIIKTIKNKNIVFDQIVGVPYGGLPFSFGVATILRAPCLSIRKEGPKNYDITDELMGVYKKGERILIVENATITANTVIELVNKLRKEGLRIIDVITVVDSGGIARDNLRKHKLSLHALFTWKDLYDAYKRKNLHLIDEKMRNYLDNLFD